MTEAGNIRAGPAREGEEVIALEVVAADR